jgi:hypothetical protein
MGTKQGRRGVAATALLSKQRIQQKLMELASNGAKGLTQGRRFANGPAALLF